MINKLKIFFSWQTSSRTAKLDNKAFILSCIQQAVGEFKKNKDLKDVEFEVLQGTGGEPGAPDMIATCLQRNDDCHIFIADISVDKRFNKIQKWANKMPKLRERPNENVMYELGRADGHLDHKQVIHVANTVFGDVSKNDYLRPVDIRGKRRPITFLLKANDATNVDEVKAELVKDLKLAIRKSAIAALDHIHEELKPYDSCEQVANELNFKNRYIFNSELLDIKKAIAENKGVLRVLGPNGIGKTRIVLETILEKDTDIPKLYCDCHLTTEQEVITVNTKIFENQVSAILILDNCDSSLFEKIIELYTRKRAKNRVYAIFDNPEEKAFGEGYDIVRFNYAYEDIVDKIILREYGQQNEVSIRIKEFASGNPLLAVLAIVGIRQSGDIRDFTNQKLVSNLLSADINSEDRIIAETLSLFTTIGYEGDAHQEIDVIATNKNITGLNDDPTVLVNKFNMLIKKYIDRGLMQRVGSFVRFRSSAISDILTDEWLERCTATQLENMISSLGQNGMAVNLVPPFFDKIREAQNKAKVKKLLEELFRTGSSLATKEFLDTEVGSKMINSLVEIAPELISECLFKTFGGLQLNDLKEIKAGRRHLVWALEKLCYKPETFEKSARLLLRLGCAEVEFVSNNATGLFVTLFPIKLPATSVSLSQRLQFLKTEMACQDEKPVLMKALERALCTRDFIRFGSDVVLDGNSYSFYEPQNRQEIVDYIVGCLDLLQNEIDANTTYKKRCIEIIASNFRVLNAAGFFDIIMPRVEKIAVLLNHQWDDLLKALYFASRDKETKSDNSHLEQIENLITSLNKTDFVSRFARVESFECNDYMMLPDKERFEIVNKKYEALAEEMVTQKSYSKEILKGIYEAQTFLPQAFSKKLASLNTDEEQVTFASNSIDLLNNVAHSIFVYYVKEVNEHVFAKIISLIYDKEKQWLMFPLVAVRNYAFDHQYVDKLFELAQQNIVNSESFVQYWNHLPISRIASNETPDFLSKVIALPDSFTVALHMAMQQYLGIENKHSVMDDLFEQEMIKRKDTVSSLIVNPHYSHILLTLLSNEKREELAKVSIKGIFQHIFSESHFSLRYEVERVLVVLFDKYFEIAWDEFSSILGTENADDNFVKLYYTLAFSTLHNPFPALIFKKENMNRINDWCKNHPNDVYKVMVFTPLTEGNELSTPVMTLLDNYGSDKLVRTALSDKIGTFSGPDSVYGERAKLIEPLTKHSNPEVKNWAILEIENLKYYGSQSRKIVENFMIPNRLPSHRWTLNDKEST